MKNTNFLANEKAKKRGGSKKDSDDRAVFWWPDWSPVLTQQIRETVKTTNKHLPANFGALIPELLKAGILDMQKVAGASPPAPPAPPPHTPQLETRVAKMEKTIEQLSKACKDDGTFLKARELYEAVKETFPNVELFDAATKLEREDKFARLRDRVAWVEKKKVDTSTENSIWPGMGTIAETKKQIQQSENSFWQLKGYSWDHKTRKWVKQDGDSGAGATNPQWDTASKHSWGSSRDPGFLGHVQMAGANHLRSM